MVELIPGLPNDMAMECLLRLHFESIPNAIFVCKNWMHEIRSRDYLRRRIVGGHNQSIFVMSLLKWRPYVCPQGESISSRLRVFELKTGNWSLLPPIPGLCLSETVLFQLVILGLNLVLIVETPRKRSSTHGVYIYNFISNMWRRGADMPDARIYFRCFTDSDHVVYVLGGCLEELRMVYGLAYDVAKDEWVQFPDMYIFFYHDAVFLSGKLHVFVCYEDSHRGLNLVTQAFDPFTWKWGPASKTCYFNDSPTRVTVAGHDGKLYVCRKGDLVVLDNGECKKVADLPLCFGGGIDCMMMKNKHLVVMGYADTKHKESGRMCMLDLESKEWSIFHMPLDYSFEVQSACYLEI